MGPQIFRRPVTSPLAPPKSCFRDFSIDLGQTMILIWLVVSTHLKNISQVGNLPTNRVKVKKIFETTGHVDRTVLVP